MKLKILEKPAILQTLVFMVKNENKDILSTSLIDGVKGSPNTIYSCINRLLENKLIQEEWKEAPRRRIFTLTKKGREMAEKLLEIEEIL